MKHFLVLSLLLMTASCFAQQYPADSLIDTASNTQIEKMLRQANIPKKVEFVEVGKVQLLNVQVIVITDLKSGTKVKGLSLSNNAFNVWVTPAASLRYAYLDGNEIDELISFLENCDRNWKNEQPDHLTHYEFLTLDNVRITFRTLKNKSTWSYDITFGNYRFDNSVWMSEKYSDDLLQVFKRVGAELERH